MVQELEDIFELFDTNGSGAIDFEELEVQYSTLMIVSQQALVFSAPQTCLVKWDSLFFVAYNSRTIVL